MSLDVMTPWVRPLFISSLESFHLAGFHQPRALATTVTIVSAADFAQNMNFLSHTESPKQRTYGTFTLEAKVKLVAMRS